MSGMARPSSFITVVVATTVTKILSSAPDRTAIRFSASGGDVYVSPDPNVAVGTGLRVTAGQHTEEVCACHQGDWVGRDLWAIASAANTQLYIIEGFTPPWWESR